ncbi:gliding motility-associated C-terminal domain-containing protein [Fibrella sp. HMF5335]|uniref:Gliding motility-associated C-terminal domain-containing protein n=1 Tax=Fibrella rubiginis TaxID=2817060 RepID=A0A939GF70_9BACT|nr:gliding motility-associated C-terminal domain-containing protein [Fibrella rubiginis]MBO0935328.1 gliding motility-associated C-terminal domain-containing protein [Fibrella rubiginis]
MRCLLLVFFITTLSAWAFAKQPGLVFVENKGQWPDDIRYRADLPGGFLFLKTSGFHYAFYDARETARRHAAAPTAEPVLPTIRAHGVGVTFAGANTQPELEARNAVATTYSYFLGNDPARWAGGVAGYSEVVYHNLYPGIDLRVFAYYQTLKYEFVIQPGADPDQIKLAYEGADQLSLADSRLRIQTSVNEFRENAPYSFVSRPEANGQSTAVEVATRWALDGNTARFTFPNGYDKTLSLTVDPELVFVTFTGSVADNFGHTATYDADGNTYVAGSVWGENFPVTRGAFQVSFAGKTSIGIMKFSPDGSTILFSATLGGGEADLPHSIIVNSKGELIVLGSTASTDYPTTAGAYQRKLTAQPGENIAVYGTYLPYRNAADMFITRLRGDGKALVGSTLLGGSYNDGLNLYTANAAAIRNYADEFRSEVIVGPDDDIYIASTTQSPDFPVTDGSVKAGYSDGVVCRLSADLSQLRWAARIKGDQADEAYSLRLASDGSLYVCGSTFSSNLGTAGALQPELAGVNDGFIAHLKEDKILAVSYLGTQNSDVASLLDIGPGDVPHVLGITKGLYPVSVGVYSNPRSGQFIHALSPDLSKTLFSTTFGSARDLASRTTIQGPDIAPTAFLVNTCGNIYIAGWGGIVNASKGYNTFSSTYGLPVTPDAYQLTTNGSNFWVGVLERGAKSLLYGTFMGDVRPLAPEDGDHVDGGTSRFDKNGVIYHATCSCRSNNFPATATAAAQQRGNANCNNVAFKFDTDKLKAAFDTYEGTRKNVVKGCTPLALTFKNTSVGGRRYEWLIGGKIIATSSTSATQTFTSPGSYTVVLRAYNPLNCLLIDSTNQVIDVGAADFRISKDTTLCPEKPVSLTASGADRYSWTGSTTVVNPTSSSISVMSSGSALTYQVSMTNAAGCTATKSVTVRADGSFRPKIAAESAPDCNQPTRLAFTNQTPGADRYVWAMGNGDTLRTPLPDQYRYAHSGSYTVVVTAYKAGCSLSQKLPIDYEDLSRLPNAITANNDGKNDLFDLGIKGAKLEIYNRWGRELFRSENYANDWGHNVAHGVYFYLLTTASGRQCKGWIEVLE